VIDHAGGKLHVIQLSKRAVTDAASRESRCGALQGCGRD
jgi:hypothetical protein